MRFPSHVCGCDEFVAPASPPAVATGVSLAMVGGGVERKCGGGQDALRTAGGTPALL